MENRSGVMEASWAVLRVGSILECLCVSGALNIHILMVFWVHLGFQINQKFLSVAILAQANLVTCLLGCFSCAVQVILLGARAVVGRCVPCKCRAARTRKLRNIAGESGLRGHAPTSKSARR